MQKNNPFFFGKIQPPVGLLRRIELDFPDFSFGFQSHFSFFAVIPRTKTVETFS